MMTDNNHTNVG